MKRFARRIVFAGVVAALLPLSGLARATTGTVTGNRSAPQAHSHSGTYGFTISGPVWIQHVVNGKNKLFFFAVDEFRPSNTAHNAGNVFRLPTALRAGIVPHPLPNRPPTPGRAHDYGEQGPSYFHLLTQPGFRLDYDERGQAARRLRLRDPAATG